MYYYKIERVYYKWWRSINWLTLFVWAGTVGAGVMFWAIIIWAILYAVMK